MQMTTHLVSYLPTYRRSQNSGFFLHLGCPPEIPQLTQQENGRGREKVLQVFRINDNDGRAGKERVAAAGMCVYLLG